MELEVECQINEGMFKNEYGILVKDKIRTYWWGWVDKELVTPLTHANTGLGLIKVHLVRQYRDGTAMVDFPGESFNGNRIRIPVTLLG